MAITGRRIGPAGLPWALWVTLFAANALPSLLLSFYDLLALNADYVSRAGMLWGRDFSNQWFGGRFAPAGLNVYDQTAYQDAIAGYGARAFQNYSYPPHTLLLGTLFALFPYPLALILWTIGGSLLLVRAARPFVPFSPWLVLLVPSLARLPYGQFGLIASALFLLAMRGSGIAAALLTMKPHLGILLAVAMAAKRRVRQIVVAVAVTLALLAAAELWFGLGSAFLDEGVATQSRVLNNPIDAPYFNVMPSAFVALRHSGLEWWGQAAVAVAALALLWQFRAARFRDLAFPIATATFIVLPYGFAYDMALVSVGFAVILYTQWDRLSWPQRTIALLAFSAPNLIGTRVVPLILLAGFWLQLRLWRDGEAAAAAA